jgi:hypothetical protein
MNISFPLIQLHILKQYIDGKGTLSETHNCGKTEAMISTQITICFSGYQNYPVFWKARCNSQDFMVILTLTPYDFPHFFEEIEADHNSFRYKSL